MALNVALVGGGIWAREEHLPAILACKDLTLKAVYSRSMASAASLAQDSHPVDLYSADSDATYSRLLQRTDISAVIIALPITKQGTYVREALAAGKHVLSEKPVAENVGEAIDAIAWYRSSVFPNGVTWSVAENWRFLNSFEYAVREASKLGKLQGFQVRSYTNVKEGGKFFETDWRKSPTHQGGFLLDGGVHYVAGLRQLLGSGTGSSIARVSSFTNLLQQHLPPVDTINSIWQTSSGIAGSFQLSVGTMMEGNEWTVAYEKGIVTVSDSNVYVTVDGVTTLHDIPNERTGVPPEVRKWAAAVIAHKPLASQEPEEALADLELLELMLRSGERHGVPLETSYQE